MVFLYPDNTEVDVDLIIGNGTNGLVLAQGHDVLKIPLLHDTSKLTGSELSFETICNEQNKIIA